MTLFVYGELCKPDVLHAVLGRVPSAEAAALHGYRRRRDARTGYYRAVPCAGAMLAGLLLDDLDTVDAAALDAFENVEEGEYARIEVEVETMSPRRRCAAYVYV